MKPASGLNSGARLTLLLTGLTALVAGSGCASNNEAYNRDAATTFNAPIRDKNGDVITAAVPIYSENPIFPVGPRTQEKPFKLEVMTAFTVSAAGLPTDIRVIKTNDAFYDSLVIEALKKWRFKPGTRNGQPIDQATQLPFVFELKL